MNTHRRVTSKNNGFTLIELMIVVVVVAIGVALAVPSYKDIIERRHTTSKAETLAAFISYARSEAVKSNNQVFVSLVKTSANQWCLGITDLTAACNCKTDSTQCVINGVEKTIDSTTQTFSSLTSASTAFAFDPIRGTKISGDLIDHDFEIESDNGNWAVRVRVSATGRVLLCNFNSSKKIPGFELCS